MRVWVYPERVYEELGARRFTVEWEELRKGKDGVDTSQESDYFDYDRDLVTRTKPFKTRAAATRYAERIAASSFFGCARVQEEVVDWFVEEDRVAHWTDYGDSEEFAA